MTLRKISEKLKIYIIMNMNKYYQTFVSTVPKTLSGTFIRLKRRESASLMPFGGLSSHLEPHGTSYKKQRNWSTELHC